MCKRVVKIKDEEDGCTYTLFFSEEDIVNMLDVDDVADLDLPSIGGSIHCRGKDKAIVMYKNGLNGHGTIVVNLKKLQYQILLSENNDGDN